MAFGLPSDSTPSLPSGRNPASLCGSIPDSMTTLELPQTDYSKLSWDALCRTIRNHPDPRVRRECTRIAAERVWDGWTGDENDCPRRMFEPDY
jgi:hypothetical protein